MKGALGTIAVLAALTSIADAADPQALAESKKCFSCHALDRERQAPSIELLLQNYRGVPNADRMLERKIQLGGVGHWGAEPMPGGGPRPEVSEAEARELAAWILTMK
jgi:cytochrome c